MKLHPVRINKTDTCLTYVVKRLGKFKKSKHYSLETYSDHFDSFKFEDVSDLSVGDVILWNKNMYYQLYPTEIDSTGNIISHSVQRKIHVGIIERIEDDKIIFSECSRVKMENDGVPALFQRNLSDLRFPDYILRLKQK